MDEVLHLTEAIETSGGEIPYGEGRFRAVARKMTPKPPVLRARTDSAGHKIINSAQGPAELGQGIIQAAPGPPELPLVGPLPPTRGQIEIAVTALNDFETCPMLYRWRHELRLPRRPGPPRRPRHSTRPRREHCTINAWNYWILITHKTRTCLFDRPPTCWTSMPGQAWTPSRRSYRRCSPAWPEMSFGPSLGRQPRCFASWISCFNARRR